MHRHAAIRARIAASTFTHLANLFQADSASEDQADARGRPRKRRKVASNEKKDDESLPADWEDPIALSKFNVVFSCAHPESEDLYYQLQDRSIGVRIEYLEQRGGGAGYKIGLSSLGNDPEAIPFEARIGEEALKIWQMGIELQKPRKNSYCKASATLSFGTSQSGVAEFQLQFCILWKNAKSLGEVKNDNQNHILAPLVGTKTPTPVAWSPLDFYENVHVPSADQGEPDLEVDGLECQLYPFQERAIRWLLSREGVGRNHSSTSTSTSLEKVLPHGFRKVSDADGRPVYVNEWLGLCSTDKNITNAPGTEVSGGILAEEMGLGKTVEIISLLLLHKRKSNDIPSSTNESGIRSSHATIIVSPDSILQQWDSEIRMHAPSLKITVYNGIKSMKKVTEQEMIKDLLTYDVVLTTYHVLSQEIYFAGATPERSLRQEKKYARKTSPLVQIHWWRCVLDECQMVESGVSQAARVVNQIPRQNAWAVSGTPLKKDSGDLLGLLAFLRLEPYCYSPRIWSRLVTYHKPIAKDLFSRIALRHTKNHVKQDIRLPAQKRVVATVPFTQIEEQYYSNLFQEMCNDCGLDGDGAPLSEDWNPNDPVIVDTMRSWLSRLRQVCLHPEIGGRNRRALGGEAPLRTIAEVLQVMIDQNEAATRTEERSLFVSQLRRGQLIEHAKKPVEALEIWLGVLEQSHKVVEDCRREAASFAGQPAAAQASADEETTDAAKQSVVSLRLRSALEVEHMSTFFVANAYYQIKTDESLTEPDSERFKELEEKETEGYEKAKSLRAEMLAESLSDTDSFMTKIKKRAKNQEFIVIPNFESLPLAGGIESRNVADKAENLFDMLNVQAETLDICREKMVQLLTLRLVDQDEDELQGDEYEMSMQQQDQVYVYMEAVRALVADRRDALTGQENTLIKAEMATSLDRARKGQGHSPELMRKLLESRLELKPRQNDGSIRGILGELRALKTQLRSQEERGSQRATVEMRIVNSALKRIQDDLTRHNKALVELDNEINLFRDSMNSRLEYYRKLQTISDSVAPLEEVLTPAKLAEIEKAEAAIRTKLSNLKSKARYLSHLQEDSSAEDIQRKCIICQDTFEIGTLTSCGHAFCKECLNLWWKQHSTCPTCKKGLKPKDMHQITYKPQHIVMQEESGAAELESSSSTPSSSGFGNSSIYSNISSITLSQIKDIDVPGSFGTKIDTLARHLLWLREHDKGAKSVIFSQFRDFLEVLGRAFKKFGIRYAGIDERPRGSGIERFKHDPAIECFFLHARAHSSGLNLVNATHVFLCEPLINTALELQAVARVHRIGQHNPTTVWMYLVEGTVEQAVYDISVQRRMAHISRAPAIKTSGRSTGARGGGGTEKPGNRSIADEIEAANSLEMEAASLARLLDGGKRDGEMVRKDDLWSCLFSSKAASSRSAARSGVDYASANGAEGRAELEVRRFLVSEAAANRMAPA